METSRSGGEDRGGAPSAFPPGSRSPGSPRVARVAGYAWLFILLAVAAYVLFAILAKIWLAAVAVFGALVITALLRPLVDLVDRVMPRALAVASSMIAAGIVVLGLFSVIGLSVAGSASKLTKQFHGGLRKVTDWLQGSPLHIPPQQVDHALGQGRHWLTEHRGQLAGHVLGGASTAAEVFSGGILALFCAVFFLSGGDRMWAWCLQQLPESARDQWAATGRAAWTTFQGYARATVLVAASNAVLVAAALLILRVPLALAQALLVFLASFVPVVGGAFSSRQPPWSRWRQGARSPH